MAVAAAPWGSTELALANFLYLIESKALNGNTHPLVAALAGQSEKIDHSNIAPGGDSTRQVRDTGL
jgi:hypothetical protein